MAPEEPVVGIGDVPGRVDVRGRGLYMLIDGDAVVVGEAGRDGEPGVGGDPDTDQDHVGRDPAAVGEPDADHGPVSAGDLFDLLV